MKYPYVCHEDGTQAHVELPAEQAPPIGHEITAEDGRVFTRVYAVPDVRVQQAYTARQAGFTSHQLPRHWKHHTGAFTPDGKPQFRTRQELQEAVARNNHNDESVHMEAEAL